MMRSPIALPPPRSSQIAAFLAFENWQVLYVASLYWYYYSCTQLKNETKINSYNRMLLYI